MTSIKMLLNGWTKTSRNFTNKYACLDVSVCLCHCTYIFHILVSVFTFERPVRILDCVSGTYVEQGNFRKAVRDGSLAMRDMKQLNIAFVCTLEEDRLVSNSQRST